MNGMNIAEKYNRNDFLSFLSGKFLPQDFEQFLSATIIDKPNSKIKEAVKLGSCNSLDLSIYEFKHQSTRDPRVTLSRESFGILSSNDINPNALAVFYNEDTAQWRLSLITSDYTSGKRKGQVKREFSNPRRFSYVLGEDCKRHTPESMLFTKGMVKSENDLVSRFAIDVVTKQFYQDLFKWYDTWAVKLVKFPTGKAAKAGLPQQPDIEKNRQHLIRLITRFMFVWFLKQKGKLVPDWLFNEAEVSKIINKFDANSEKQGNYYNGVIQNLFFATLNRPIKERIFAYKDEESRKEDYGINTKFRDFNNKSLFTQDYCPVQHPNKYIELFNSLPFLNGGLFECLDDFDTKEYVDGFSREEKRAAFIPNCLFWGENDHEGLIPLLSRYNFTIEENTPQDIDIALDPELLGKVFENLLGTFNEETSKTARNESGSFYTPREIVDYMVDSSLKEFLKGKIDDKGDDIDKKFDNLFLYHEAGHEFDEKQVNVLMEAISKCKILDPACGSGAFPMGVLNRLAFIMQKLDPKNELWREIQIKRAMTETEKAYGMADIKKRDKRLHEIKDVFDKNTGEYRNYTRKLFLIENCIYGVDIQPIAIQISKLRFFISLIVDQKTGGDIDNNYNVLPLPNLETKFVAANSLIGINRIIKNKQDDLPDLSIEKKQRELLDIRQKHFNARDAQEKLELRKQDKILNTELSNLLEKDGFLPSSIATMLAHWDPYNQNKVSEFFDPDWMFGIKDGFDVIIGNPPYIQLQNNRGKLADLYSDKQYECYSRSGDIYQIFYEVGYKLLIENGHLCLITSNKWMRAAYGEKTRNYFANKTNPKILIDFAGQRVFETATVDVNIILIQKCKNQHRTKSCIIKEECKNNMTNYIRRHGSSISFPTNGQSWVILSDIENRIKEKIEKIGKPLKDWEINIYRGILTGCNEAFIIDKQKRDELIKKDCKSAELIRPILRGRDIKRYGYEFAEQYIIATFPSKKYDIDKYPAIRDYLLEYGKKRLEQSGKSGARKETKHKWFETQDSINYWDDFTKQKLLWAETMRIHKSDLNNFPRFSFSKIDIFTDKTCFFATGNNLYYLLAYFNSSLGRYLFKRFVSILDNGGYLMQKVYLEQIPIARPTSDDIQEIEKYCIRVIEEQDKEIELILNEKIYSLFDFSKDEVKHIENDSLETLLR